MSSGRGAIQVLEFVQRYDLFFKLPVAQVVALRTFEELIAGIENHFGAATIGSEESQIRNGVACSHTCSFQIEVRSLGMHVADRLLQRRRKEKQCRSVTIAFDGCHSSSIYSWEG